MTKFYCTAWANDDQILMAYTDANAAREVVAATLYWMGYGENYDECWELADLQDFNRDALGIGIVEIDATCAAKCWDVVLTD